MTRLPNNHLVQFAALALVLSLLGAVAISAYVSDRLSHDIELLQQHGEAMREGTLSPEDPFSIPGIQDDVREVRWTTFAITAGVLATIYLSVVLLVWRGWRAARQRALAEREAEALRQQNERLREIDRMKGEFVALASHELSTPLTGIYGFSKYLARAENLSAEQREWASNIHSESQRLRQIVDSLLDVSRVERGSMKVTDEAVDLDRVITKALAAFEHASGTHSFRVKGSDSIQVRADPDKLVQVISNLVDNAVKYSPDGGLVTISCAPEDDRVRVSVSDSGLGIPQAELPNLFQRFHRIDRPETAHIRSTGLGLYIVSELVSLMGGAVEVESVEGEGTTVTILLPACEAEPAAAA